MPEGVKLMDYKKLGKRIRYARIKNGFTQAELAEALGYSIQHISHVENFVTKMSVDFIVSLAKELEVSLDELFSDSLEFPRESHYKDRFFSDVFQACSTSSEEGLLKLLGLFKIEIEECMGFIRENIEQKDSR